MGLLSQKMSPQELKKRLSDYEHRLSARENDLKQKRQKARDDSKKALSDGNDREFRISSQSYGMLDGQIKTISGMLEIAKIMTFLTQMQEGLKEIVAIGEGMGKYQKQLGIDPKKLENAVMNIKTSMDKVSVAATTMTAAMDTAMNGNEKLTDVQDLLRQELMAELSAEREKKKRFTEKIRAGIKDQLKTEMNENV